MSTLTVQTLQAPTSGANANKVLIPSGHTLDASNGLTTPAGHVVQCQQFYNPDTAHVTSTSTSFVASGITKSITPKYSNSLIIIQSNISMAYATSWMEARMYLNGSAMPNSGQYHVGFIDHGYNVYSALTFTGQYQASSTSALNFEIYYRSASSATAYITHDNASAALTLWEIAQ